MIVSSLNLWLGIAKPQIRVRFWNPETGQPSEEITAQTGEKTTLEFLFENTGGHFPAREIAATKLTVHIYFSEEITFTRIARFEREKAMEEHSFKASPHGKFKGMQYVAVPSVYDIKPPAISILSFKEVVSCKMGITFPSDNKWPFHCQIISEEGNLDDNHVLWVHSTSSSEVGSNA